MKIHGLLVLASFLMTCVLVTPAAAGVAPYVRLDYGGNQLRMTDRNIAIRKEEASLKKAGYPATFQEIGFGYGPSASVGLWILPGFRLGAAYSYLRAVRNNRLDVPGEISYADDLDFRMNEVGVEAAVRFKRLAGLTVGVDVAGGWAKSIENYSREDADGLNSWDEKAYRTKPTCGAFVGIDQTNPAGVAGFIRAGFQYRDMGRMPVQWTDYSGFYVRAGLGYDLVR